MEHKSISKAKRKMVNDYSDLTGSAKLLHHEDINYNTDSNVSLSGAYCLLKAKNEID